MSNEIVWLRHEQIPWGYVPWEYDDGGYGMAHAKFRHLLDFEQDCVAEFVIIDGPCTGSLARLYSYHYEAFEDAVGKHFIIEYELEPQWNKTHFIFRLSPCLETLTHRENS